MSLATVAIVGCPNVGKSTLFNRIAGRHAALVDKTAGVTRDRHYGDAEWLGRSFRVIDTGGLMPQQVDSLMDGIRVQTECAIAEADVILFVVDARAGVTAADQEIASRLRKVGKPVFLIANKAETAAVELDAAPFYSLGCGEPFWISAEHGRGVGDVLDAVCTALPLTAQVVDRLQGIQVAIVGRPNVGKSSLINRILGEQRLLVSTIPGTTRDAIDSQVQVHKKLYTLADTAGMRKPRRIDETLEKAAVAIALKRIRQCEVAVLMLDAVTGVGEQDVRIGAYIEQQGKACIIAINKWDAIEKTPHAYEVFVQEVRASMPFLFYAPILSISALTGQRIARLFPLIDMVFEEAQRRVSTAQLNEFLKDATEKHQVPMHRGKFVKFSFMVQSLTQPPTFLCFANYPSGVTRDYKRYLEHQLRKRFGFCGTPLRLFLRKK